MNNPILDLIHKHASVRCYKSIPVTSDMIDTIISSAQCASTSSNLQTYSVIVVTTQEKRLRLAELCGDQTQVRDAPVFLAWCADLARLDHVCQLRGYTQVAEYTENFLIAAMDVALAAQNAALTAESLSLGICYIGGIRDNPTEVIELLELPRLVFPIIGMTLGWPEKQPDIKPRLPLPEVMHWEKYNPPIDEYLTTYDETMISTGVYTERQVPVAGKTECMEDYSWSEHSARRVSQALRTHLRQTLEKQGFKLK
jgi:FMN reductase (NADPH)